MPRSGQRSPAAAPRRSSAAVGERTYLLVHPERFPSNDWDAVGVRVDDGNWSDDRRVISLDDWSQLDGFDESYGAAIAAEAARCSRRVCLLDETTLEEYAEESGFEEELTVGLPVDGWELVCCEPQEVGRVVRRILKDASGQVLVAGYARNDCVARALTAARKLGLDASLHEAGTLPLNDAAAAYFFA